MTTLTALEERVIALEDFVFEQLRLTMPAVNVGVTKIDAETVANGQAITDLRVSMAALEGTLRGDIAALKHAMAMRGDSLRTELGGVTARFRGDVIGFRETMSMRFLKADGQFNAVHAEMSQRFDAMNERLDALDAKLDSLVAELRGSK
jgi:hypothetical protein